MSKASKKAWHSRLSDWHETAGFARLVDECTADLGRFAPMIEHGTQFWRDAWIAAEFARLGNADKVRLLHPLPYPDFAVEYQGNAHQYEATEALFPNRRRGDQYREDLRNTQSGVSTVRPDPPEDWLTAERAADLLTAACKRKLEKPYAQSCGLVIYLNASDYGHEHDEIVDRFGSATKAAGEVFESVHILWDAKLFQMWPHA